MAGKLKGRGAAILAGLGLVAVVGFTAASWRTMAVAWEERKLLQDLDLIPEACKSPDDSVAADALRKVLHQSFEARQRVVQEFVRAARKSRSIGRMLEDKTYSHAAVWCDESQLHAFTCRYRSKPMAKEPFSAELEARAFWPWVSRLSAGETYDLGGTPRVQARMAPAADVNRLEGDFTRLFGTVPENLWVCLLENQLYEATLENLLQLFQSNDKNVRGQAALFFGKLGAEAELAIPTLLKALESRDEATQQAAAVALAGMGEHAASAMPAILRLCQGAHSIWACDAITASQKAHELLSEALNAEPDIDTRRLAIFFLRSTKFAGFDPRRFLPQLEDMSSESDPIGSAAREAIEAIRARDDENKSP